MQCENIVLPVWEFLFLIERVKMEPLEYASWKHFIYRLIKKNYFRSKKWENLGSYIP